MHINTYISQTQTHICIYTYMIYVYKDLLACTEYKYCFKNHVHGNKNVLKSLKKAPFVSVTSLKRSDRSKPGM